MIHQLAARKATKGLKEGLGLISKATVGDNDTLSKDKYEGQFALLQRGKATCLGVDWLSRLAAKLALLSSLILYSVLQPIGFKEFSNFDTPLRPF